MFGLCSRAGAQTRKRLGDRREDAATAARLRRSLWPWLTVNTIGGKMAKGLQMRAILQTQRSGAKSRRKIAFQRTSAAAAA